MAISAYFGQNKVSENIGFFNEMTLKAKLGKIEAQVLYQNDHKEVVHWMSSWKIIKIVSNLALLASILNFYLVEPKLHTRGTKTWW